MTIESDVERILAAFAKQLEGVEVSDDIFVERESSTRTPQARDFDPEFKERMLTNAPRTDGERIIAEKRSW